MNAYSYSLKKWIPRMTYKKKPRKIFKKRYTVRAPPFKKRKFFPQKKPGFEKMNCHPAVENKTVHENSCFTTASILKIKEAYNRGHPQDQIVSTQPRKIWEELNRKLSYCKREDCWLKEIKDSGIKKQVEAYFSPKRPKDWDKNPNEWLSDHDILAVLKQYEQTDPTFEFIGPAMIDFDKKLPEENYNCVENRLCQFSLSERVKRGKTKIGVIFNLDDHTKGGSHWVSMFIDVPEKTIFYFDSAGNEIPLEIRNFKDRVMKQGGELENPVQFQYYDNDQKDHQKGFTECGMYSLFFIVTMLTHKTEFDKNMSLDQRIRFFQSGKIQDKYVEKYRKIYFNSPS